MVPVLITIMVPKVVPDEVMRHCTYSNREGVGRFLTPLKTELVLIITMTCHYRSLGYLIITLLLE